MEGVIGVLIGSNVIALIILIIRSVLRKYLSKRFVYGMWILIPLFMLVYPFVEVPVPEFVSTGPVTVRDWADVAVGEKETLWETVQPTVSEKQESKDVVNKEAVESKQVSKVEGVVMSTNASAGSLVSWADILAKAYVVTACLVLTVIVCINVKFILRCKQMRVWREKSFGLGLAVYELSDISSPFLFGRSIYIPVNMTEDEMRYGTLHEEYHYRHGDSIWVIVRYLILAIHFYSPIMWAAFKASGYDCELACDEAVMARIHEGERQNYGRCLLQIMENSKYRTAGLLSTNMKSGKSLIKERIKVIASETRSSLSVMMVVVAFLLVVVSWMLLEKTTQVAAKIEASDMASSNMVSNDMVSNDMVSLDVVLPDVTQPDVEEADVVQEALHSVLRPYKLGQYYTILSAEPWIVEDKEGVLFGYLDDIHVEGGPTSPEMGPWFGVNGTASSVLPSNGDIYYEGAYAAMPERTTTWAEGVYGDGIGEYVEVQQMQQAYEENTIDGKLYFEEICIVTGNAKNGTTWKNNNRAKTLNLYFEDEFVSAIELEDTILPQYIDISALNLWVLNGEEANFKFEIVEVYEGDLFHTTCITGIDLKYRDPN